jgi:flagellar motor switch protein FliN
VPLEFSVVLGKSKKTIREVLSFGNGSVIELDKQADEPLEIYVNGKLIAQGEVVVINENFGIRITNIMSKEQRLKELK